MPGESRGRQKRFATNLKSRRPALTSMTTGMTKRLELSLADAELRVQAALKTEGFGVLTRIDLQATLKQKLGVEVPAHLILGACNPTFAHRALGLDPAVALMLPCNVTLQEDGDGVLVRLVDPLQTMAARGEPPLLALAGEVRDALSRVREHL